MAPKKLALRGPSGERRKKDSGGDDRNKRGKKGDDGEDRNDKGEWWCRKCQAWRGHNTESCPRGGPIGPKLKDSKESGETQLQSRNERPEHQSDNTSETTTTPRPTPSSWRDPETESQGLQLIAPVAPPNAADVSGGPPKDTRVSNRLALTKTETENNGVEACVHCSRPNFGSGEKVWILTNYFAVSLPKTDLHTYTLQGIPQTLTREKKQRIIKQLVATWPLFKDQLGCWATDQASLVVASLELSAATGGTILQSGDTVDSPPIQYYTSGSRVPNQLRIALRYDGILDFTPYKSFMEGRNPDANVAPLSQALNMIMAKHANTPDPNGQKSLLQVGTNRFFYKAGWTSLTAGLVAYRGYFSSVRPGMSQVLLNVNKVTTAIFEPGFLHVFIRQWFNIRDGRTLYDHEDRELNKVLRGVKVRIMYDRSTTKGADIDSESRRTKLVMGIGESLRTQKFTKDDQEVLVRDYLRRSKSTMYWRSSMLITDNPQPTTISSNSSNCPALTLVANRQEGKFGYLRRSCGFCLTSHTAAS